MATNTNNIFKKMSAATAEINAVAKNLAVGYGKSSYKAAGEADVLAAVKPIEEKHGIYSYPVSREILESGVVENTRPDGSIIKQNYMRICVVYRFVNTEEPKEYIDITSYGDGIDPGDKATGKAMTYADKYALMKAYKIITGEDPDQYMSQPMEDKKPAKAKTEPKKTEPKTEEPAPMYIDGRMQTVLSSTLMKAGKKPSELEALQGIKGWKDITIEQFKNAMKELGEV